MIIFSNVLLNIQVFRRYKFHCRQLTFYNIKLQFTIEIYITGSIHNLLLNDDAIQLFMEDKRFLNFIYVFYTDAKCLVYEQNLISTV